MSLSQFNQNFVIFYSRKNIKVRIFFNQINYREDVLFQIYFFFRSKPGENNRDTFCLLLEHIFILCNEMEFSSVYH